MQPFIKVELVGEGPRVQNDHLANPARAIASRLADVPTEALVNSIQQVTDIVSAAFKPSSEGPESCAVKFGLKISGEGHIVLAKVGSELNLEVTVTWKR